MFYIISTAALSDISKFEWDCDEYGNTIENEETYLVFRKMEEQLDPFCLTRDKSDASRVFKFFGILYPDIEIKQHILKNKEYYKLFPKCWHNLARLFHSQKYKRGIRSNI